MWRQVQITAAAVLLLTFSAAVSSAADSALVLSCHDIIQPGVWPCDYPPPPCEGRSELLLQNSNLDQDLVCDLLGNGDLGWLALKCEHGPCRSAYSGFTVQTFGVWEALPKCPIFGHSCSDPAPPVNGVVTGYPDENGNYTCGTHLVRSCPACHGIEDGFVQDICTCQHNDGKFQCEWSSEFSTFENKEVNPHGICLPTLGCCPQEDPIPCNTSNIQCGTTTYQPDGKDGAYAAGTKVTWTSASGFGLSEDHRTAVCQCNGTWSRTTPCCACNGIPDELPNGHIKKGSCTDGVDITYTVECDDGYHRFGPQYYHCQKATMTPISFSSSCEKTQCPCEAPEDLPNAEMIRFSGAIIAARDICYVSPTYKCMDGRTASYICTSFPGQLSRGELPCQ